ncbi:MAG TPA: GxxExxY protein [Cyclobacteriaceae bacterium]
MQVNEDAISRATIGLAMKVHSRLRPGLLESAYRECLAYELRKKGFGVETEKSLPLVYDDIKLNHGYRIDVLIDNCLVLELKTVEHFIDVHFAQMMTYLKVGNYKLGLLLNFNVSHLRDGIRRVVNGL